jgi:hypothetical protein
VGYGLLDHATLLRPISLQLVAHNNNGEQIVSMQSQLGLLLLVIGPLGLVCAPASSMQHFSEGSQGPQLEVNIVT